MIKRSGSLSRTTADNSRFARHTFAFSFLASGLVGLLIVCFRENLLPPRFSFDSSVIQSIASGRIISDDANFSRVAALYAAIGLTDKPTGAGLLALTLVAGAVLFARARFGSPRDTATTTLFVVISICLGAVFLGTYSKDIVTLVLIVFALALPRKREGHLTLVLLLVSYGVAFRAYWIVVALLFFGLSFVGRRYGTKFYILSGVIGMLLAGVLVIAATGTTADHYRILVNEGRAGVEDTRTMIEPFLPYTGRVSAALGPQLTSLLNVVFASIQLFIPWPLLAGGTLYYLGAFFLILFVWMSFFRAVAQVQRRDSFGTYSREISLVYSFLLVQGLFEPDYGSALRHLVALMPLMLCVLWAASTPSNSPTPALNSHLGSSS